MATTRTESTSRVQGWTLAYNGFDPAREGLREALCSLGNGRFASRGAAPEAVANGVHYPGTYAAGCFNRLTSEVAGRAVEDESLVNLPNWLPLTFRIEDGEWFDLSAVELIDYAQVLDMRHAVLMRMARFRDREGRETGLTQRRFMSMAIPQIAALETTIRSVGWSGRLTVRSALDGRVVNGGVERYRELAGRHLVVVETGALDEEKIVLEAETNQSRIRIAEAARTRLTGDGKRSPTQTRVVAEPDWIGLELETDIGAGEAINVEKVAALYTSHEPAISEPGREARRAVAAAAGFDELLAEHGRRWAELWDLCSLDMRDHVTAAPAVLRVHTFHLLQTVSEHTIEVDAGIPARGLTGEAYRGHIFWDALFIFPFLNLRLPEVTRALMRYRYRRLNEARRAAREAGYKGAMYPWQSGSSGEELTPTVHLNPRSGRWVPDNSRRQRHINAEVAYNLWLYHQVTEDDEFLAFYGAEMFVEIARFWASIATYNRTIDRYEIRGVMGPDEYHDAYPDGDRSGIDNNAYTNAMAAWVLWRAPHMLDELPGQRREEVTRMLGVRREELEQWENISRRMLIPFHDGIISQFQGYEELEELDWDGYRERYGNIRRLDRILEAEGDSVNRYKASKQADVLMLFYLLSADELGELFDRLGYPLEPETIPRTASYYEARTSHGSTLSAVVHAWVLARSDRARSWDLFAEALESDVADVQGGTTPEGVHLGAMAGTVDLLQRAYTGLETREGVLWLNPALPAGLRELRFNLRYRRHWGIDVRITRERIVVTAPPSDESPINLGLDGDVVELAAGETVERAL
jgi:alpha,alpha-trehalase